MIVQDRTRLIDQLIMPPNWGASHFSGDTAAEA
jgi:hypothetical protein